MKRALAIGGAIAGLLTSSAASSSGERTVLLFSISKSENRNQVQFAERLDASCAPVGDAPVFAYWRMLEQGPAATEPLLDREQPAYGIASQVAEARRDGYAAVRVTLRAFPRMPILVESRRAADGTCSATARTPIDGVDAKLFNVHAVLRWPFGVARLLVTGWAASDGRLLREQREP